MCMILNPHVELRSLLRHYKQYPIPMLVSSSDSMCSGRYWSPCWASDLDYLQIYDPQFGTNGVIEISIPHWDDSTLAHEYCHHLQYCKGVDFHARAIAYSRAGGNLVNYALIDMEHDAFTFEYVMFGPSDFVEERIDKARLIVRGRSDTIDYRLVQ